MHQLAKLLFRQCSAACLAGGLCLVSSAWGAGLPAPIASALSETGLPESAVAVWVSPAENARVPVVALNVDKSMQPASSIKVVTTAAALDLLKPNYHWHTDIYAKSAPDKAGVVRGLTIRGSGDPHLVLERLWLIAERLNARGVRTIAGNIALDRSAFAVEEIDPGAFDGEATRTYNVGPDALMANLKTVSMTIAPEEGGRWARVTVMPRLDGVHFPTRVRLARGGCGDWKKKLKADLSDPERIRLRGAYPAACGRQMWHLSLWTPNDYFTKIFKRVLRQAGIVWKGRAVAGKTDPEAKLLVREYSEPLSQMVNWINKYSNNPMARQLFLTLSFADQCKDAGPIFDSELEQEATDTPSEEKSADAQKPEAAPASLARSRAVVERWLTRAVGTQIGSIYVDNGSGLSRETRATARALGEVLSYMYRSGSMPEFMASLPRAGIDGTMRRRALESGAAHIKTGYLNNVRSIAGYVTDASGRRWCVVVMINHDKPQKDRVLTQAVLNWAASGAAAAGSGVFAGTALELH